MALTERDRAILVAVERHRFLSRDQIAEVFFPASASASSSVLISSCNARLQRLFQHGYLARSFQTGVAATSPAIYSLDRRGVQAVATDRGIDPAEVRWSPKRGRSELYFREHTLAVNDIWVAAILAERCGEAQIEEWVMDGPGLWDRVDDAESRRGYLPVRPDAYLRLVVGGKRAHFLVEVDRATMSNRRFAEKIRAYQLYWREGRFSKLYDARSFRVLVTAPSARRRNNLRRTAASTGARAMFLFAVQDDVMQRGLFAPIWHTTVHETPRALTA
jgi:hypothetical protein